MQESGILAVDLDKTLIKSDILYESLWKLASSSVSQSLRSARHLLSGKAHFKAHISEHVAIDPSTLAYNEEVLDYIRTWRRNGGRVMLITATDQSVARSIADHLGLFDEVFGSDGLRNLKGRAKAEFLVDLYGAGNYDYMGDCDADLPVWQAARKAITVGAPPRLRDKVRSGGGEVVHLAPPTGGILPYLKAIRPHQWSKNILVFLPLIAAHEASLQSWMSALFAFIGFSLVASSVYVLNDLLDLAADRNHPRKRNRPLASGAVPLAHGTVMAPGLLVAGLLFSLMVWRLEFFAVMALYYVVTMAYSLSLKRKLIIDICTLAGLYSLRVFAGAAATDLSISPWLLAFTLFFFFSLAAIKRQAELVDVITSGRGKAAGREYEGEDGVIVSMMAISAGYVAVLVMALYIDSPGVQGLYNHPQLLWGICPILLYWISRMVMMTHRGYMDDDPIVFSVRDPISRYCGILCMLIIVAGTL